MSRYPLFDRALLRLNPLSERQHDLTIEVVLPLRPVPVIDQAFNLVGASIVSAKNQGAARILMMGAHVLRKGCQLYIIDLLRKGFISCLAVNGAVAIHDYELALIGATTESVAKYIRNGQFGLWRETGKLNDIVSDAAKKGLGAGEAIGRAIWESSFPHKKLSVLAAAWAYGVPVTVHVGIGNDIIAEHPNFDGEAWGKASYTDFLIFTHEAVSLEGGVVMNFGSAVMAPEVYLKALAMVRNASGGEVGNIAKITTLVCDLHDLPQNVTEEAPKNSAAYYFRPWKTMLVRTVADGGQGLYVKGDHSQTMPQLWTACLQAKESKQTII
jgi:hypothetical protein